MRCGMLLSVRHHFEGVVVSRHNSLRPCTRNSGFSQTDGSTPVKLKHSTTQEGVDSQINGRQQRGKKAVRWQPNGRFCSGSFGTRRYDACHKAVSGIFSKLVHSYIFQTVLTVFETDIGAGSIYYPTDLNSHLPAVISAPS